MSSVPLRELNSPEGATALAGQVHLHGGGDVDSNTVAKIRALIQKELSQRQESGDVEVNVGGEPGNANYNFLTNKLQTNSSDPIVLQHELGHVHNLQNAPAYQKLILASRGLVALNRAAAPAVMLGLRAFATDPHQRQDILNTLSGINAAAAAPNLVEEASASADAIINSDDKVHAIMKLLPALGLHGLNDLLPTLLYQIDRRL